jgi:uncharacterized protein (TIGR00369 family)
MNFDLQTIPFARELGFTLELCDDGKSLLRYTPRTVHGNSMGVVHGGALMALLDVTMATAACSVNPGHATVTIEMKTTFMRPAALQPAGELVGRGRLLHRTHKMAFVEGSVFDAGGALCTHATGTFKYVSRAIPGGATTIVT